MDCQSKQLQMNKLKEHITKKLAVNEQVKQFEFEANFTDKTEIEFVLK